MNASSGGEQLPQAAQGKGLGIFESGDGKQLNLLNDIKAAKKFNKKPKEDEDQSYTTVMLRNIPNKYTRQMLVEELNKAGFLGDVDYLYLPTDFTNRCNVGYCFCNFRTVSARQRFQKMFDGKPAQSCLPGFNSYKVCQVTKAKWQGRAENVKRLKSSPELMLQLVAHPEWLPVLMNAQGEQEPFPVEEEVPAAGQSAKQRKKRAQAPDKASAALPATFPYQVPGFPFVQPEAMAAWQQMASAAGMNFGGPGANNQTGGRGRGNGKARGKAGNSGKGKGRGVGNAKSVPADAMQAQMAQAYAMLPMMGAFPPVVMDQNLAMQGMEGYDAGAFMMPNFYPMMPNMEAYANFAATQGLAAYSPESFAALGAAQTGTAGSEDDDDED